MSKFLTMAEREAARKAIKQLDKFNETIEKSLRRGHEVPVHIRQTIYKLTGCADMGDAYEALLNIRDLTQKEYLKSLKGMASKSLSAFAEYINPDQPPAPHHEFLIEHLEAIESGDLLRMLLSMPPGHAKPIVGDAPVLLASGRTVALRDVKVGDEVVTHNARPRRVTAFHEQGKLKVWEIRLASGRVLRCAEDHPWFTPDGKKLARDLTAGDALMPVAFEPEHATSLGEEDIFLMGMFHAMNGIWNAEGKLIALYADMRSGTDLEYVLKKLGKHRPDISFHANSKNTHARLVFTHTPVIRASQLGVELFLKEGRTNAPVLRCCNSVILAYLEAVMFAVQHDSRRHDRAVHVQEVNPSFATVEAASFISQLLDRLAITHKLKLEKKEIIRNKQSTIKAESFTTAARIFLSTDNASMLIRKRNLSDRTKTYSRPYAPNLSDRVRSVTETDNYEDMFCLTVEEDHSFVAWGYATHNSTYSSLLFPAWFLGRNPKKKFILGGHTQLFCENNLGKPVRNIIKSAAYQEIFPEVMIPHDQNAAATFGIAKHGGVFMTRAVGQGIAGIRGNIGGIDDPYPSYQEAESAIYRQKVLDWFNADYMTRMLPNSPIYVVATRWHVDDLCGYLEDKSKSGKILPYTTINLPLYCLDPETDPLNRAQGEKLWKYFDDATLKDFEESLSPRMFSSLYLGRPYVEGGNILNLSNVARYEVLPEAKPDFITLSADTANKATQRADFTVITVWYQYANKHYLIDTVRKKLEYHEIKTELERLGRVHKPHLILVEDAGTGSQYATECRSTNYTPPAPVHAVSAHGSSKEFRFDAVVPIFNAGDVLLPKNAPWMPAFEAELTEFPLSKNDDQVDSVSQYLLHRRPKPSFGTVKMGGAGLSGKRKRFVIDPLPPAELKSRYGFDLSEAADA